MDYAKLSALILIFLLIVGAVIGVWAYSASKELLERENSLQISNRYFLEGISPVYIPHPQVLGIMIEEPDMTDLIMCLWEKESSYGTNMYGDYRNGVPLSYGHFQIQIAIHPVSYECAMDFSCSSDYVIEQVRAENGWMWTPFEYCVSK